MKSYLFLGDTHDDLDFTENAAKLARNHSAEIIQLGDWGFLGPGEPQLKELSDMLIGLGVTMRFVDGNHDDHPRLKKLRGRVRVRGVEIAKNVIYQPRGSVHRDEDGTRFLFLGGAPSIDGGSRQLNDALSGGTSWWPEEVIIKADLDLALSAKAPVHVLVTHDAPTYPPGFAPKGSPSYQRDQVRSMKSVDALIRRHRPTLHVHGHWHSRYSRTHKTGTITEGLNCNELDSAYLDEATLLWSRTSNEQEKEPA